MFGLRAAAAASAGFLVLTLCPLIIWVLPDTHDVPKLAGARLQPFDGGLPLLLKNAALREAISLRVLIVAPYVCYELVGRQFIMRKYFQTPTDAAQLMLITGQFRGQHTSETPITALVLISWINNMPL